MALALRAKTNPDRAIERIHEEKTMGEHDKSKPQESDTGFWLIGVTSDDRPVWVKVDGIVNGKIFNGTELPPPRKNPKKQAMISVDSCGSDPVKPVRLEIYRGELERFET